MTTFLKVAGTFVLGSVFAGGAVAAPIERSFDLPEWSEDCALPSVTASSPLMRDNDIRLASDNQPATAESTSAHQDSSSSCGCSTCESCPQCNSCCCPPSCYASVGTVILHRDRPDGGTIVASNPGGAQFHSASDFDFGWNAGPDITIGRRLCSGDSIEGRFFEDDGAEANVSFRTPGNFIGSGFTGPTNTLFEGEYRTLLYSSELNYRHPLSDRVDMLAGFRWVELTDTLRYQLNTTVAGAHYTYNNHLYGAQLGADYALTNRCSRLQANAVGKAGLYGNVTDGGIYEFSGPNRIGSFTGEDNTTAFIGELDFSAAYWLTCHVAVRGGYQLLWLDDVALASDAASRSLLNPSLLRSVGNDGNLFYNGATIGLDFVW